jgi:hypothetical protein
VIPADPARLTPEQWEWWAERAGIREFCGGMDRTMAEMEALKDLARLEAERRREKRAAG